MAMVKRNRLTKYRSHVESLVISFNNGLNYFATFVEKSSSFKVGHDEIDHIASVLKPTMDVAKNNFDEMKKCGKKLLDKVNKDFAESTHEVEQTKRELRNMDSEIACLSQELKGIEKDVTEAEKQCDTKRANLRSAENALSKAKEKLNGAETAQVATEAAGYTTAAVCLGASFVFPPALIGVAAGAAAGVVGSTALREAKKDCENVVTSARREVSSSEKDLNNAKENKRSTEQQLSDLSVKKDQANSKLKIKQKVLDELKTFQKDIIEMNQNIKTLYKHLSSFHGRFNVLHHETRDGYSISLLRNPTLNVCGSMSTLLNCKGLQCLCESSKLIEMNQQLRQIQSVEWPLSIEYQDDDDDLSLI